MAAVGLPVQRPITQSSVGYPTPRNRRVMFHNERVFETLRLPQRLRSAVVADLRCDPKSVGKRRSGDAGSEGNPHRPIVE
jgi:hypothetical protein